MSVGIFTKGETNSNKRDGCLMLVDISDPLSPMTDQGGGQPQIRKPGQTTWTDTAATLVHVGNGHYVVLLTTGELDTLGVGSIRYQDVGQTVAEFQDTFYVQPTGPVSNDEIKRMILKLQQSLNWITQIIQQEQGDKLVEEEISIL